MHKRKLTYNTITSILLQLITVVSGFIIPRLILETYGSEVNGLVSSITQFVGVISFLELGVGAVVQSSLYRPLAENDELAISRIYRSANKFFRTLATILLVYIIVLVFVYPFLVKEQFDFIYTAMLIVAMSISWFAQYFFGIVNGLVLKADQKGYILFMIQGVTVIINTITSVLLMRNGYSIQIVKLCTSLIFLARPLFLSLFVSKHYKINKHIQYTVEPISQKWNGVAQHVAAVVLDSTDTIVLTLLSTLANVSIYGVYHLVVNGIKQFFFSVINGFQSLMGELYAKNQIKKLQIVFSRTEWAIHTLVTFIYGSTLVLIVPFVLVYTKGVTDANYNVPLFATLITIANACHCLRMPYFDVLVKACNKYKETQNNFIVAAALNILVSIITVKAFGLIGVAIGTLAAMLFQTVWMAWFCSREILHTSIQSFIKHIVVDVITIIGGSLISQLFTLKNITYTSWVLLAVEVSFSFMIVIIITNLVFYWEHSKKAIHFFINKIRREK